DAELETPAGEVVDCDGGLRQHARMAVRVAGDYAADPDARGRCRHGTEHRPSLENIHLRRVDGRPPLVQGRAVVEPGPVGYLPDGPQSRGGRPLLGQLKADPERRAAAIDEGIPAVSEHRLSRIVSVPGGFGRGPPMRIVARRCSLAASAPLS